MTNSPNRPEQKPKWVELIGRNGEILAIVAVVVSACVFKLALKHHLLLAAAITVALLPIYFWLVIVLDKWRVVRIGFSLEGSIAMMGLGAGLAVTGF